MPGNLLPNPSIKVWLWGRHVNSGIVLHPRLKKGSFGWRGAYYEGGLEKMAAKERLAVKIGFIEGRDVAPIFPLRLISGECC